MKFSAALCLAAALVGICYGSRCVVDHGRVLSSFSDTELKMEFPCKYVLVNTGCGNYKVKITPGNRYVHPTHIIDSVSLDIQDRGTGDLLWQGTLTNKQAGLYILGEESSPLTNAGGSLDTVALLNITKESNRRVIINALNGDFGLVFSPFDFANNRHQDSRLQFDCNSDMESVSFPDQFCGNKDNSQTKNYAKAFFGTKKKLAEIVLFSAFDNSSGIVQTDKECKLTTDIMSPADNDTRIEIVNMCREILDTELPRECVLKHACSSMATFRACVQFVESGYTNDDACRQLGEAINLCNGLDELQEKVRERKCYNDLLTREDLPYYRS